MINNKLESVLDDKKISQALIKNSVEKLNGNKRLYIFSDHSDSRKPYSSKLENIGKVRSLDGGIINGYTTLGSVILDENKKELTLSNITVFSNKQEDFLIKKELKDYNDGKIKNIQRKEEIAKKIEKESYINMTTTLEKHLQDQSKAFKEVNPDISLCHVHDRGCDSVEHLEFVSETLKDDAVVRVKKTRNSNQTKINPKTNRKNYIKLIDSEFANKKVYLIKQLTLKGKCYSQAKCLIEWDTITLNEKVYTTVRSTLLKRDGNRLYKEPMLLITTLPVKTYLEAKEVYHIYLHRSKIEGVFKFLKDVLGWEEYQVRDWESIKNIIAICFFVGGYFYEIKSELTNNQTIQMICDLARSKGKITHYFFLEGLRLLLIAWSVQDFRLKNDISDKLFAEMQAYAGILE
ncbi:MAG: transposase [Sulfurimonas sp.]|nr:transposase [Sulfurimonas sp.]